MVLLRTEKDTDEAEAHLQWPRTGRRPPSASSLVALAADVRRCWEPETTWLSPRRKGIGCPEPLIGTNSYRPLVQGGQGEQEDRASASFLTFNTHCTIIRPRYQLMRWL